MIRLEAVRAARERIAGAAVRTPLVRLDHDAGRMPRPGPGPFEEVGVDPEAEVWLKLEVLQPVGSFKIRGAANAMAQMSPQELARGVVTASAGNMAQGVAWNARRLGLACTVVAPDHAPEAKIRAVERLGGRVVKVPFDEWWQTFVDRGRPDLDGTFVHAFDDERVMAGNGTIGLELIDDLPDADAVLVPWGGGGLACGIASAVKALRPSCRVLAVEVETGAPLTASLAAGSPATVDYQPSFVDGIGSKTVFASMLERAQVLLDGSVVVSLDEVAAAVRLLAARTHVIAEGAGAAAVAAAVSGRVRGRRIACIVSGGSIDASTLARILTASAG
ncbi:MAG TPA: pyridoxal-phosphate dependent enzyme [Candidatus Dormibacteraeota bacterium]|nr:pyridoxal-phosphate dependent enzyme [Candidatus Dormibacteraeota bacterium]